LSDFNAISILSTVFRKHSNIKFHSNPSSGSRVVPCGKTDGRTDIAKLMVALWKFANAPKERPIKCLYWQQTEELRHVTVSEG